jgi:hypothetical protein
MVEHEVSSSIEYSKLLNNPRCTDILASTSGIPLFRPSASMATPRVLILGGHGKVSMYLQPLLLAKKWNVTSVVRNTDHEAEILALGQDKPGKIEVLVDSLDEVKEVSHAKKVLDKVKPDIVVWSAGEWLQSIGDPPFDRGCLVKALEGKVGRRERRPSTKLRPRPTFQRRWRRRRSRSSCWYHTSR